MKTSAYVQVEGVLMVVSAFDDVFTGAEYLVRCG